MGWELLSHRSSAAEAEVPAPACELEGHDKALHLQTTTGVKLAVAVSSSL